MGCGGRLTYDKMVNNDIIQELNNLESSLSRLSRENIYSVPKGYFDSFEARVRSLIWLSTLPSDSPYAVPTGYFNALADQVMQRIRNHPDYQSSKEELASISPLLNSLDKRPVYSVPEGYFENFNAGTGGVQGRSKIISLGHRKWFRYAAAAIVTGVVAVGALMIYNGTNSKRSDSAGNAPLAKFEKEVKKIDDVKSTEKLIDFMDAGLNEKELATNHKTMKTEDVQQLLKDVSTEELSEFSEQSKDIEDVMMTN